MRWTSVLALATLVAAGCSTPEHWREAFVRANADALSVTSPRHFPGPANPRDIVAAQLDSDGLPDLVTETALFRGLGAGAFGSAELLPSGGGRALTVTDLDSDGDADLVVVDLSDETDSVKILLNDGEAHFTASRLRVGRALAVVTGDFNEDDFVDLVVASSDSHAVQAFLGDGAGHFSPGLLSTVAGQPTWPRSMAVTDLNGDGHLDLVAAVSSDASGGQDAVVAKLGRGDGIFENPRTFTLPVDTHPRAVTVADFDVDGHPDAAALAPGGVVVFRGQGDGSLWPPTLFPGLGTYGTLSAADLDLDGHLDLLLAGAIGAQGGAVSFYAGDGALGFAAAEVLAPLASLFASATVADLNDDRKPDVAYTDTNLARVSVILNRAEVPFPVNLTPPSVHGVPSSGQVVTCNPGGWSGNPRFEFSWRRGEDPIPSATHAQYQLAAEDAELLLACEVSAVNRAGAASARSGSVVIRAAAELSAEPALGPPGSVVRLAGSGFTPGEAVDLDFAGEPLASFNADAGGAFSTVAATIPGRARSGRSKLRAIGRQSNAAGETDFRVETDWAQFGGGPAHNGWNRYETRLNSITASGLRRVWGYTADAPIAASPIIETGTLYVGSTQGTMYALDARRAGDLKWLRSAGSPIDAPAAAAYRKLVFATRNGDVWALDKAGAVAWTTATDGPIRGAPVLAQNRVYVATQASSIWALDIVTGARLWSSTTNGSVTTAVATQSGRVFVGTETGHVHGFEAATGAPLWSLTISASVSGAPAVAGNTVYFPAANGHVYAVRADSGALVYDRAVGASGALTTPSAGRGLLILGDDAGSIRFLNSGNGKTWFSIAAGAPIQSALAATDHLVFFGTSDGRLGVGDYYLSNAILYSETITGGSLTAPIVADTRVYVGTAAGEILAYGITP